METLDRKFFDHVWVLWNNLQDVDSSEMVESCIFFIEEYDFDMDVLPEKISEEVNTKISEEAYARHCENEIAMEDFSNDFKGWE